MVTNAARALTHESKYTVYSVSILGYEKVDEDSQTTQKRAEMKETTGCLSVCSMLWR
jgi:hypothetical protein